MLLNFGAMFGPLIASGEYWRLFTAMFLHVGFTHLFVNGFALFVFGPIVERAFGPTKFLTIYLLGGLTGSVASYLLNSIAIGAGASGGVFAVIGGLAAFFVVQTQRPREHGPSQPWGPPRPHWRQPLIRVGDAGH